jgi:hypothetical protein
MSSSLLLEAPVVSREKKKSVAPVYTRFPQINDDDGEEEDDVDNVDNVTIISSGSRHVQRRTQYLAALAANMGALALGTVLSWPAVGKLRLLRS